MRDTVPPCGTIDERNGVGRRNRPSSDAVGPFLAEMSAPLSRASVGTFFSRAKYTPDARRRPGPDTATREDEPASRAQRCAGVHRAPQPARMSPWRTFPRAPSDRRGARHGRRPARGTPPGARGGAGCPNLLQRPGSSRGAREETLIFRTFFRGRSRPGTPLQQIWTRPVPDHPRSPTRTTARPPISITAPIRAHGSVTPGKKGSTVPGTPARSIPVVAGPVPAVIQADLTDNPLDPSRR